MKLATNEEGASHDRTVQATLPPLAHPADAGRYSRHARRCDVSGAFRIATQPLAGIVTGTWRIVRQGRHLHFEATPSGGWTPGEAPPMARLLFRVVSMFRTWPTTYSWMATLQPPEPGEDVESSLPLQSVWERLER